MATATESGTSKDVALEANKHTFDDSALAEITNMHDALSILGSVVEVESWDDYGTGFDILDNKDRLVGVPFVILEWRFTESKQYSQQFVSAVVVDENDNKFIVNDGSTGICAQLQSVTDRRIADGRPYPQAGLVVKKGLRRSDYEVEDPDGKTIEASTYYLA